MKKYLLIFCFIFPIVALAQTYMLLPIISVYDGDTIKTSFGNRLPSPLNKVSVRIRGIDTPERGWRAKCEKEANLAEQAKQYLTDLIKTTNATKIKVENFKWDKYGSRILADVKIRGIDVASYLMSKGVAVPYSGSGPKFDWCK